MAKKSKTNILRKWVPNYHGAWIMISAPILIGAKLSNFSWAHLLLFAFWLIGYFDFYALTKWLKAKFNKRYRMPVIVYSLVASTLGIILLILYPRLISWSPPFIIFSALSLWAAWKRNERGMLSNISTILAACLMLPLAYGLGIPAWEIPIRVWIITAIFTLYFLGSVFYVKTNIRKRGSVSWYWTSCIFHTLSFIFISYIWIIGYGNLLLLLIWIVILLRAILVPQYGKKVRIKAKNIGISELILSLTLMLSVLFV